MTAAQPSNKHHDAPATIPVTLLTGFLGAGKTTLVNHLLTECHSRRLAVIVNEFGELGIDGALIAGAAGSVIELANGCICCATKGDLRRALQEVLSTREGLDGVLIETSGLADPEPVIRDLESIRFAQEIRLDGVVTVLDAENFDRNLDSAEAAFQQITYGAVLLINKIDLVDPTIPGLIEAGVRRLNPAARITSCTACDVPLDLVLGPQRGIASSEVQTGAPQDRRESLHHHTHSGHEGAHGEFETVVLRTDRPLRLDLLANWLDALPTNVFRAKGFVRIAGEEATAVLHVVGQRRSVERGEDRPEVGGAALVVIGRGLDPNVLQEGLSRCMA